MLIRFPVKPFAIALRSAEVIIVFTASLQYEDEKDTEVKRDVPGKGRIVIKRKGTGPITSMLENECKNNRGEKTVLSTSPRN